ncbi:hypothetical protein [Kingella potus]|uniref:hypothetical protein n=1 Tax=Kingella potus TaxID=265175 RepID=UPI001FD1D7BE|nr:hypothetical protein [Kingella potus]UOO99989.1 hypothetical protein LVJ84_08145 [Kingella potus]
MFWRVGKGRLKTGKRFFRRPFDVAAGCFQTAFGWSGGRLKRLGAFGAAENPFGKSAAGGYCGPPLFFAISAFAALS